MPQPRQRGADLDQQGGFADAGIAADQQHRAAHEAAAGDAIEFADRRGEARRFMRLSGERLERERTALAGRAPGPARAQRRVACFLDQRVPFAAGFAFALPAAEGGAAILADEIRAFVATHVASLAGPVVVTIGQARPSTFLFLLEARRRSAAGIARRSGALRHPGLPISFSFPETEKGAPESAWAPASKPRKKTLTGRRPCALRRALRAARCDVRRPG